MQTVSIAQASLLVNLTHDALRTAQWLVEGGPDPINELANLETLVRIQMVAQVETPEEHALRTKYVRELVRTIETALDEGNLRDDSPVGLIAFGMIEANYARADNTGLAMAI